MNIFTYLSSSWYLGRIEKIYSRIRLDFLSHIHTDVSTLDLIDIYFTKELKTVFVLKILLPVLFWPHTRVTPLADNTVIYSRRSSSAQHCPSPASSRGRGYLRSRLKWFLPRWKQGWHINVNWLHLHASF